MVATVAMAMEAMVATGVDTARGLLRLSLDTDMAVATDTTARGLLMPSLRLRPRLSLAMATTDVATAMVAMAVATTARGLLMPSLRLMPLLRLSPATAAAAMDTTARGRLRLSPVTAMAATVMAVDTVAMVATGATAMVATARGLLSLATATGATAMVAMATATAGAMATGVSYHRIRRSELSQKQNHKNSQR